MVTLRECQLVRCLRKSNLGSWIHPVAQSALDEVYCYSRVSVQSVPVQNRQTEVVYWGDDNAGKRRLA